MLVVLLGLMLSHDDDGGKLFLVLWWLTLQDCWELLLAGLFWSVSQSELGCG